MVCYTSTTTQTRPHHHKNTATKRPAREHRQKKISTRTPPQTHHHKNTTTKTPVQNTPPHHHKNTTNARRCSATHMLICTKPETAYSHCVLHFSVALICVFDLCSAFFFGVLYLRVTHRHGQAQKPENIYTYRHTVRVYKIYCEIDVASRLAAEVALLWLRSFVF